MRKRDSLELKGVMVDPRRLVNPISTDSGRRYLAASFKDGVYEHPRDSFLYGMITFAPRDPAKDAGILRTRDAIREATKLFERAGMYAVIPRGTVPVAWAAKVLEARATFDRLKEESRARRLADREDERRESALYRNIAHSDI